MYSNQSSNQCFIYAPTVWVNVKAEPRFSMMGRAHSFLRITLPNSAGQLAKFRGSPRQNHPNSAAGHGRPFMNENWESCSPTSVTEGWHHTKGWYGHALAVSTTVSSYCVSALSYVSSIKEKIFFSFKSAMKLMTHDLRWLKWLTDESVITHHAMIIQINSHFSNSTKFHRNVTIPQQRAYSAARLEILRPAENCGP